MDFGEAISFRAFKKLIASTFHPLRVLINPDLQAFKEGAL